MFTLFEHIRIKWKWLLSFRRSDWTFDDYPIRVQPHQGDHPSIKWVAQVLNWFGGPVGTGITRKEAVENLRTNFAETLKWRHGNNESIPRPGAFEQPRFASFKRVNADRALLERFIQNVLSFPPGDPVFISDESSLLDFGNEREVERMHGLIRSNFGVDVSDVPNGNIADILERIAKTTRS